MISLEDAHKLFDVILTKGDNWGRAVNIKQWQEAGLVESPDVLDIPGGALCIEIDGLDCAAWLDSPIYYGIDSVKTFDGKHFALRKERAWSIGSRTNSDGLAILMQFISGIENAIVNPLLCVAYPKEPAERKVSDLPELTSPEPEDHIRLYYTPDGGGTTRWKTVGEIREEIRQEVMLEKLDGDVKVGIIRRTLRRQIELEFEAKYGKL